MSEDNDQNDSQDYEDTQQTEEGIIQEMIAQHRGSGNAIIPSSSSYNRFLITPTVPKGLTENAAKLLEMITKDSAVSNLNDFEITQLKAIFQMIALFDFIHVYYNIEPVMVGEYFADFQLALQLPRSRGGFEREKQTEFGLRKKYDTPLQKREGWFNK